MDHAITQIGIGGIFAILVIREVLNFLGKKKDSPSSAKTCEFDKETKDLLFKLKNQVDDLYKWHDQRDADGVPVWYIRRSLEEAIVKLAASQESLADCIKHQTSVLERLIHSQEEIKHSINDINRK